MDQQNVNNGYRSITDPNNNMTMIDIKKQKGFTLIELLVVIGILAILLAITLIAINPARQFGQANDTKRRSDITQVLNAIGQYTASNGGILPAAISGLAADTATSLDSTTALAPLCALLVPNYLPALPTDPNLNDQDGIESADCAGAWDTDYTIERDAQNRVTVSAVSYDGTTPIEVTR
jgi:prepilin-type N-terminal cleavage/methylation domain-containing protein